MKKVQSEFSKPATKVHRFVDEDQFNRAAKLRLLGWNVEPCEEKNCAHCIPDTPANRKKLEAIRRAK